jgi:hypothetical protein
MLLEFSQDNDIAKSMVFDELITIAKFKIMGGQSDLIVLQKEQRNGAALAILACTATLYVSPASSLASELVRSYMATLVGIDKFNTRHLISYPSEPILSEAALEILSSQKAEDIVLEELDKTLHTGGILNGGEQGELCVRLLLLFSWKHLIYTKRNTSKKAGGNRADRKVCISYLYVLSDKP